MTARIKRLWQPGNPQFRVFLPDFWVRIVETPTYGRFRLPKNCVKFEVDKRMSRHEVREYLEKIYDLPVRDVRTEIKEEIEWVKNSIRKYHKAMWKEDERKFAYVFLKKGVEFEFPKLFAEMEDEKEISKVKEAASVDHINAGPANRFRRGVGEIYGI